VEQEVEAARSAELTEQVRANLQPGDFVLVEVASDLVDVETGARTPMGNKRVEALVLEVKPPWSTSKYPAPSKPSGSASSPFITRDEGTKFLHELERRRVPAEAGLLVEAKQWGETNSPQRQRESS